VLRIFIALSGNTSDLYSEDVLFNSRAVPTEVYTGDYRYNTVSFQVLASSPFIIPFSFHSMLYDFCSLSGDIKYTVTREVS
jgi:hypothetical protein